MPAKEPGESPSLLRFSVLTMFAAVTGAALISATARWSEVGGDPARRLLDRPLDERLSAATHRSAAASQAADPPESRAARSSLPAAEGCASVRRRHWNRHASRRATNSLTPSSFEKVKGPGRPAKLPTQQPLQVHWSRGFASACGPACRVLRGRFSANLHGTGIVNFPRTGGARRRECDSPTECIFGAMRQQRRHTMRARISQFWNGPSGMREVLLLALPLMVSTLSWTIMHFTDRVFLMWYSQDAVAAALPAGALQFAVLCFPLGLASYVNAFVSQYYGAKRYDRIGLVVWQGVWLGLLTVPVALATIPFASFMFGSVGHTAQVAQYEIDFYSGLSWGSGAMVIAEALSTFFTGRGGVRTVMIVDSTAAVVNMVLDYLLIFGNFGFPAWGVSGAAWATVTALWFKAAVYLLLFLRPSLPHRVCHAVELPIRSGAISPVVAVRLSERRAIGLRSRRVHAVPPDCRPAGSIGAGGHEPGL